MKSKTLSKMVPACVALVLAFMMLAASQGSVASVNVTGVYACSAGLAGGTATATGGANTGKYTSNPTVEKTDDEEDTAHTSGYFEVNPKIYGGKVENEVEPTIDLKHETRNLTVAYHDTNATEQLEYNLEIDFQQENEKSYTITWNNYGFAAKWKGEIDLKKAESKGKASWRAWAYHPWLSGDEPPTKVSVLEWETGLLNGPLPNYDIDKDETVVFDDGDPSTGAGLKTEFSYDATATGATTFSCKSALWVKLNHYVTAEYVEDDTVYKSESKGLGVSNDGWLIYDWKLRVEITTNP